MSSNISDFTRDPHPITLLHNILFFSIALKKSELYTSLRQSCDELRGGIDASKNKDYVLVLLFIKYAGQPYAPITVPKEGASFADMVELKGKSNIGE
jgi:type I restriction enzyme M protein